MIQGRNPNSPRQFALFLGTSRIGHANAPETLPPTAYFCETCGQVWGRAVPIGSEGEAWRIYARHCPRHPLPALWWETPGSFTQTAWIGFDDLDRDALLYEFERIMERNRNEHAI